MKGKMKGEWFCDYLERKRKERTLSHERKHERKEREKEREWQ